MLWGDNFQIPIVPSEDIRQKQAVSWATFVEYYYWLYWRTVTRTLYISFALFCEYVKVSILILWQSFPLFQLALDFPDLNWFLIDFIDNCACCHFSSRSWHWVCRAIIQNVSAFSKITTNNYISNYLDEEYSDYFVLKLVLLDLLALALLPWAQISQGSGSSGNVQFSFCLFSTSSSCSFVRILNHANMVLDSEINGPLPTSSG